MQDFQQAFGELCRFLLPGRGLGSCAGPRPGWESRASFCSLQAEAWGVMQYFNEGFDELCRFLLHGTCRGLWSCAGLGPGFGELRKSLHLAQKGLWSYARFQIRIWGVMQVLVSTEGPGELRRPWAWIGESRQFMLPAGRSLGSYAIFQKGFDELCRFLLPGRGLGSCAGLRPGFGELRKSLLVAQKGLGI